MCAANCFIVTVGISLLARNRPNHALLDWTKDSDNNEYTQGLGADSYVPVGRGRYSSEFTNLVNSLKNIREAELPACSAELAGLYAAQPHPFENSSPDRIYLIGTRTAPGDFCAEALKEFLSSKAPVDSTGFAKVETIYPPYLGSADDPVFAQQGLPAFLDTCQEIIKRNKGCHVILVPNGGYKTLIVYLTLLGLLRGLSCRYVYEDSKVCLMLPQLPLGLDIGQWQREKVTLEAVVGKLYDTSSMEYLSLGPAFRTLLENRDGRFALSLIGKFLEAHYREAVSLTPLALATTKTRLLDFLETSDGSDYKGMFLRLVQIGHLIWKGDRVPEMVDHSLKHHLDLFDLAERILLPLFQWRGENFLAPRELFLLLGAIYLHDCGHVVGIYRPENADPIRLFPSEVREYHHILGYERLRRPDLYMGEPIYDALTDSSLSGTPWGNNNDEVWRNHLKAIATLGAYHRKIMPLETGAFPFLAPAPGLSAGDSNEIEPLVALGKLNCGAEMVAPGRAKLLVCLLRMIDSLDEQSSRTGDRQDVEFHAAMIENDIAEVQARIEPLERVLRNLCGNAFADLENACQQQPAAARKQIKQQSLMARELAFEYARQMNSLEFKKLQKDHFARKEDVERIAIEPNLSDGGKICFTVRVVLRPSHCMTPTEVLDLLGEMEKEYTNDEVKVTLKESGITFDYAKQEWQEA